MPVGLVGLARILINRAQWTPGDDDVRDLLKELRDASFKTEEGRHPGCLVTCYQRTGRPPLISRFTPLPLTAATVTKLALATDPRTSSVAALHAPNGWEIHGVVDRGLDSAKAGAFQVEIEGVGHLSIHVNGLKLAELIGDEVHERSVDVLVKGLLSLSVGLSPDQAAIVKSLLYRVRRFGHGGALIISTFKAANFQSLDVKYTTTYVGLQKKGKKALDQALWFVALLSRIDGAVLLDRDLQVVGFGAFLRSPVPRQVHVSNRTDGTRPTARAATSWGTRHQSMFGYCAQDTDAAGFIVSNDGDIRAVKFDVAHRRLVMWERVAIAGRNLPAGP